MGMRKFWKRLSGSHYGASPTPCATPSTAAQSFHLDRANDGFKYARPSACSPGAAITSKTPPPVLSAEPAPEPRPTKFPESPLPVISKSEQLWNAAYDRLERDDRELVESYVKCLETILGGNSGAATDTDLLTELHDPVKRQMYMRRFVEEGRAKIAKASKIMSGVGDVIGFVLSVREIIDGAVRSAPQAGLPWAALPWAGVCLGLQMLQKPGQATKSNLAGIAHVISRMDWYCALTDHLLNKDNIAAGEDFRTVVCQLEKSIVGLYKALLQYQMKSICSYYRNQGFVFLRSMLNLDDWDGDMKLVTNAEAAIQNDVGQLFQEQTKTSLRALLKQSEEMNHRLGDIHRDIQEFISLQKDVRRDAIEASCRRDLRVVDPQDDMDRIEKSKDELLDDAYNWILRTQEYAEFTNWDDGESGHPSRRLLWIRGHAGTGKTMLMIGLIRKLSSQPAALSPGISFFFCQDTDAALNTATAVLRSLFWLLLLQQPQLISHLLQKYRESGASLFTDKNAFIALSKAFRNTLMDPQLSPVYLAIDALDECREGRSELIELILTSLTLSSKVKWLVSGRPEVDLRAALKGRDTTSLDASSVLVELDTQRLEAPVNAYINHKLSMLRYQDGYDDDDILNQVSDEVRTRADNTFLWVALAFKVLETVHGAYAVKRIREMPPRLSELYDHMMTRIEEQDFIEPQDCKTVLVITFAAFRPLSILELSALLGMPLGTAKKAIEMCGSFVTSTDGTVNLIHQSAKDYLERNFHRLELTEPSQAHSEILKRSIDAMSAVLRRNIYNLDFTAEQEDITPPNPDPLAPIRYSCVFWADHLCSLNSDDPRFRGELMENGRVSKFIGECLLHWFESLILMGALQSGLHSIRKILDVAESQPEMNYKLTEMLKDAEKFVDHHEWVIHWNPVQIYGTALGFSPALSKVRHQYWKERLPFIDNIAGIQENWDDGGQTPKGRRNEVNAVTFSPDGKTLASCSDNTTIRLWDPKTGACHQTLEGHTDWVKAVAFSPNGKTLASASKDKTIRLWDTITGTCQQTLKGHTGCIGTVVFSPDGKTLASGSNDTTIRLWDLETGTCQQTLNGHTDWVRTVVFSPDGMVLASGSDDGTIRLWDPLTGMCQQTLEHVYGVTAVAVSPDGKRLASALIFDETIRLWDLETGECEQMLRVSGEISTLVFYRDGQCLETNRGLLSLEFDASSGYGPAEPAETGALFVGRDWITWDGKRLLWIRWYRTKCVAVYGHTVVLGDEAGQVVFIRFSFPE